MNKLYLALGAALAFTTGLMLHINIRLLIILFAAVGLYLYSPAVQNYCKSSLRHFLQTRSWTDFDYSSASAKILYLALAGGLALFIALKLHINIKFVLYPLAVIVLFFVLPALYNRYKSNIPQYHLNHEPPGAAASVSATAPSSPVGTKQQYIALGVVLAFFIAFELHLKFIMYPLAAVIFYLYVPGLYFHGKICMLQYAQEGEPANYFAYLWFSAWFSVTCILSYMLSHLVVDLISSFHWGFLHYLLHAFVALTAIGGGYIGYLEWNSKKIELLGDIHTNFEKQGRLASFEILLIMLTYFMLKH